MIGKYFKFFTLALLIGLFFTTCRKQSLSSIVPNIKYAGYTKLSYPNNPADSLVFIKIDFEDGDGDIGLGLGDSAFPFRLGDPYYYNLFAEYLQHVNGAYSPLVIGADTTNYNDRIPNLTPESRNKSINGTITIKMTPITGITSPDSVILNIYVVDRAQHKSNIVSTGAIPVHF
jgi:hypothetical protein